MKWQQLIAVMVHVDVYVNRSVKMSCKSQIEILQLTGPESNREMLWK